MASAGQQTTQRDGYFCSRLSRQAGEQIFGTAAEEVTVWLVLEYPWPWGAKALLESDLPPPVKERLFDLLDTIPGARFQFIKRKHGEFASTAGITFYVGVSQEHAPIIYEFQLESYGDLLTLDVPAVAAGDSAYRSYIRTEPLFLVCTNGKRDRCCAKWGLPVYGAMRAHAGGAVWQTTHTGGHRFAPTMICLPHGVCYGRIAMEDVEPLVDAYGRRRLYRLDRYRGRSCYDRLVQAADYFVRERTGILDLDHFQLTASEPVTEEAWEVSFATQRNRDVYRLRIVKEMSTFRNPLSCGRGNPGPVPQYRLLEFSLQNWRR